jgi:iron complex transport system ATP-binding protein
MIEKISFEQLGIGRKGIELIQPFTAELRPGSLVILTGANGAGKSTLLKTMVGLLEIVKGGILIDGQPLGKFNIEARSKIFAYANSKKIEEEYIRIIDLVGLGRYPYLKVHQTKFKDDELITHYLNILGIAHIRDKFLNEVSDGELQKAAIARALVQDTPVIIMDEPTAFLDYPSKKLLFSLMKNLALDQKKCIVCATHDVEMAAKFGTHFWHLENKELKFSGKGHEWLS